MSENSAGSERPEHPDPAGLRFVTPKNVGSVKMRAGIEPEFGSGYVGPHEAGFLPTLSIAARNDGDVSILRRARW